MGSDQWDGLTCTSHLPASYFDDDPVLLPKEKQQFGFPCGPPGIITDTAASKRLV